MALLNTYRVVVRGVLQVEASSVEGAREAAEEALDINDAGAELEVESVYAITGYW